MTGTSALLSDAQPPALGHAQASGSWSLSWGPTRLLAVHHVVTEGLTQWAVHHHQKALQRGTATVANWASELSANDPESSMNRVGTGATYHFHTENRLPGRYFTFLVAPRLQGWRVNASTMNCW